MAISMSPRSPDLGSFGMAIESTVPISGAIGYRNASRHAPALGTRNRADAYCPRGFVTVFARCRCG
ncbi:MAG: hypothetical protein JWM11_6509 [Planctomycetaceae bacterium]|nr:hypothetical protein [Planctomycetaceae bacterium]